MPSIDFAGSAGRRRRDGSDPLTSRRAHRNRRADTDHPAARFLTPRISVFHQTSEIFDLGKRGPRSPRRGRPARPRQSGRTVEMQSPWWPEQHPLYRDDSREEHCQFERKIAELERYRHLCGTVWIRARLRGAVFMLASLVD